MNLILVLIIILIVAKALPYLKRKFTSHSRSVLCTKMSQLLLRFYLNVVIFITKLFIPNGFISFCKLYIQSIGGDTGGYKKPNLHSIILVLVWLV